MIHSNNDEPSGSQWTRRQFVSTCALAGSYAAYVITTGCGLGKDFDMVISGGLVFDGTGKNPVETDVGVKKGRIIEIGDLKTRSAHRRIDASGLAVAPGFIDMHSHSDDKLLVDGTAQSKIRQGVTTEIGGQDGDSLAPLNRDMRAKLKESLSKAYGIDANWSDFKGYYKKLRKQGISVNYSSMVGAGTLREYVIGFKDRPASEREIRKMQGLLKKSLDHGARHLSTGLEYTPGSFATTEELAELCTVLGDTGVYATHMRNEDDRVLQAVGEAIEIARSGGVALNISHLKAMGQRNWNKLSAILLFMDEARANGLRVTCDRYPYVAYSTGLTSLFPLWCREGGTEAFLKRLSDPEQIDKIRSGVQTKIDMLGSWDAVMIASMNKEEHKAYEGRRLGELASELAKEPFEVLRELMLSEEGHGGMVGFAMSEENTTRILTYPYCAIASDGSARATEGPLATGNPHPRNFGTFPRVLGHYVREMRALTLQEAIRKMTSLPAGIVGIADRGQIAPDFRADITLFNPDTVADQATFAEPKQYPVGIEYVLVNGEVVIDQGDHTGARPGIIL